MEVHAADQYLVAPGEVGLLEVYEALEGTGPLSPLSPGGASRGRGGLVARGGFAQTFFFPAEVLGLTFHTPKGEVVRAGGLVVKNVQGYDLVRPFVGSFGLLGEALEVVFRLRPGRAFAFLKRPWEGAFPELSPRPRFLFALEDALYAFHYGHEKEVARFREAFWRGGGGAFGPPPPLPPGDGGGGRAPKGPPLRLERRRGGPKAARGLPPLGAGNGVSSLGCGSWKKP
jgi:glycolate oxidase FAD binding subunit